MCMQYIQVYVHICVYSMHVWTTGAYTIMHVCNMSIHNHVCGVCVGVCVCVGVRVCE